VSVSTLKSKLDRDLRSDFPMLSTQMNGQPLVYLDNAASMQKPRAVINRMSAFYESGYSNIHRSVHRLSQEATDAFEGVRVQVQKFIGAGSCEEVIFTRGTTESINLVANSFVADKLKEGDEILLTRMEHHANFVPWLVLSKRLGLKLQIVELTEDYRLDLDDFRKKLSPRVKFAALSAMSNVLGLKNPLKVMLQNLKEFNVPVLVDAAQWAAHERINLRDFPEIDFLAFSAHKLAGPTGVGVLYGKKSLLQNMPPYQLGGEMILEVSDESVRFNELPHKFEAGTSPIAEVIGFGAAIEYLESVGFEHIERLEAELTRKGLQQLRSVEGLEIFGPLSANDRIPLFSFRLPRIHPHDLGTFLDSKGIAVRAGHHCGQPLHQKFGWAASLRASFCFYNTEAEVDFVVEGLNEAKEFFKR